MMPSEKIAQFSSAPPLNKIEERRDAAARIFRQRRAEPFLQDRLD